MSNHRSGRPERRLRAQILAISTVCWICGHPGSQDVDEKWPHAKGGTYTPENLAPAHGVDGCPTCGRKCNREKSDNPTLPVVAARSRDW